MKKAPVPKWQQTVIGVLVRLVLALLAGGSGAVAQTFTLLHTFTGSDGVYPVGTLIQSNATLYGMTTAGVFKMNTDGGSCSNLHYFSSYGGNGKTPYAAVTLSGTNLYGMTVEGGAGVGVIFRLSTSGSGYTNLHNFAGGTADGAYPGGELTLSGTNFYGLASLGGSANLGVVFRIGVTGNDYTNLHSFIGYPADGSGPPRSLTLDGTTLYGMTQAGGTSQHKLGMVFRINTDGSGYTNLHSFAGGTADGATPLGSLTLANGALYGMTSVGGSSNYGVVFRLYPDGSGYTLLHSFTVSTNDGATPYGSLLSIGTTLYGMTYYGGAGNKGVVFTLTDQPTPPALLTIAYVNNQAIISWPAAVSGWTLQTNGSLAAGTWGNYSGPVVNNTVTSSPTRSPLYFRLAK